jgi:hypothetical protein
VVFEDFLRRDRASDDFAEKAIHRENSNQAVTSAAAGAV